MIASANEAAKADSGRWRLDDQAEDEHADHDRRHAVEQVERQPDRARGSRCGELGQIDRDQHAERQRDGRGDRDDQRAADDRVGDPAAGRAEADLSGPCVRNAIESWLAPLIDDA